MTRSTAANWQAHLSHRFLYLPVAITWLGPGGTAVRRSYCNPVVLSGTLLSCGEYLTTSPGTFVVTACRVGGC